MALKPYMQVVVVAVVAVAVTSSLVISRGI